jgi:hypothetical protein
LWILIELIAKELEFVEDAVGVLAVLVSKEIVTLVVDSIPREVSN